MSRPVRLAAAVAFFGLLWVLGSLMSMALAQTDLPSTSRSAGDAPIENYSFRSEVQERRFHALISNMRCLVNPEQSLAESTAAQAREMRSMVFGMLQDDRVDFEIRNNMVNLYGEAVLYQSAFPGHRLLLQAGPVLLLVVGLIAAFIVSMRKRRPAR